MPQINNNPTLSSNVPTVEINDISRETAIIDLINKLLYESSLPPDSKKTSSAQQSSFLPNLQKPSLMAGSSSISLDILLDALGDETRRNEMKSGLATIKANATSREAANKEKIAKIEEEIEKLDKKGFWDKFASVFKAIAAVATLVAGAALLVTGIGSVGGAALILTGLMLADSVLDTVGEAVSGHGWGLTSGIGFLVGKISGSEEAGMWTKVGLDLVLAGVTLVATMGTGTAASVAKATDTLTKIANMTSKVASIVQASGTALSATTSIAGAVYQYQAAKAQADQKQFEAILERIALINQVTTEHLRRVLEESQNNTETVKDIIKENIATQTTILTGGATSMA